MGNVNDNTPVLIDNNNTANAVAEDAAAGAVVGITALATDADRSVTITKYELTAGGDKFEINQTTGVVLSLIHI